VPKRGKFKISVTNNGKKPVFEDSQANQEWLTYNDHLRIDKEDPMFKASGSYIIGVTPAIEDHSEWAGVEPEGFHPYEYSIKFSYSDKHSMLSPGIPERGVLHSDKQCFVI
jgi:hypothetical protein